MGALKWLAVIPFIAMFAGPILHNSSQPFILGLPFELAWIVGCVLLTSALMAMIYRFDPARLSETEV